MSVWNQILCNASSKALLGKCLSTILCAERLIQSRTLYAQASLGIDQYVKIRERTDIQFGNSQDRFKSKMMEFSEESTPHMIFTEDLKSMLHIAQADESDLSIVKSMMKKFNKQNREVRFGSYVFGPVVMRMYHYLNQPKEALEVFKDPSLNLFFDQIGSYHILMDLLFINEMYDEMLEVFDLIKTKQVQMARFPKNVVVLYMAACYKLNTPKALKLVTDLWQELQQAGYNPMRRATTFAAMLAVNQNAPHIALELISTELRQSYVTVRNIKVAAMADLGRVEDTLPLLRNMLQIDDPNLKRTAIHIDVLQRVRNAAKRTTDKEVVTEFERLERQLEMHELISMEPLDVTLCSDIVTPPHPIVPQRDQRDRFLSYSYNRRSGGPWGGARLSRPGLTELQ